jgi:hypothetical protein
MNYYRCDQCGRVWAVSKDNSATVTQMPRPSYDGYEFSRQSQLRLIEREISRGHDFLRLAQKLRDDRGRKDFLGYARGAHALAIRVLRGIAMEPDYRENLQRQLDDLATQLGDAQGVE